MQLNLLVRALSMVALASAFVVVDAPGRALAHERREVGKYQFVVGFNEEPALQGEPNGAQITISEGDRRIEGLASSLKLTVAAGGGTPKEFPLRAVFGQPGRYVADFIPTRPGAFVFNFTGTIEGQQINERFESGPGRFDEVKAVDALQFPEPVPPGNEVARAARSAEDRAVAAEAAAGAARTMAMVGIGVGILGAAIGLVSLVMLASRRSPQVAAARR
jgi:hypothetical protein